MPEATVEAVPMPSQPSTRTGMMVHPPAMPAARKELLQQEAMMAATWVPCPYSSSGYSSPAMKSYPGAKRVAERSGARGRYSVSR